MPAPKLGLIDKLVKSWHGSPHDFDKFDFSHMGRGEGAQAYGWGGYSTADQDVAKEYRRSLSSRIGRLPELYIGGKRPSEIMPTDFDLPNRDYVFEQLLDQASTKDGAMKIIENQLRTTLPYGSDGIAKRKDLFKLQSWVDSLDPSAFERKDAGHLYELGLDVDPAMMIDWQKPLHEQKGILDKLGSQAEMVTGQINSRRGDVETLLDSLNQTSSSPKKPMATPETITGKQLYMGMAEDYEGRILDALGDIGVRIDNLQARLDDPSRVRSPELLSELSSLLNEREVLRNTRRDVFPQLSTDLSNQGVQGIQYMGEFNKTGKQGARNYVNFNADDMKILNKYLHPATATGTGILGQILMRDEEDMY